MGGCSSVLRLCKRQDSSKMLLARRSMTGTENLLRTTFEKKFKLKALPSASSRQAKQLTGSTLDKPKGEPRGSTNTSRGRPEASSEPPRTKTCGRLTHPK